MEENSTQNNSSEEMNMPERNEKNNYYTKAVAKVVDFFIGFFGAILYNILITFIFSVIGSFVDSVMNKWMNVYEIFSLVIVILGYIALIVYFMRFNKRKYIGIGLLGFVIFVLIAFGGCILFAPGMIG